MRDAVAVSLKIAEQFKLAESAISGEFFRIYSASIAPKSSDIATFRTNASAIARSTISEVSKQIAESVCELASEAATRAYSDITKEHRQIKMKVNSESLFKGISGLFIQFIADGESVLRQYASRVIINTRSGWPKDKAVAFAKSNTSAAAHSWSKGKIRFSRFPLHHSLFLAVSSHITSNTHIAYIQEAVSHGVTMFEIVQPDHRRNGLTFGYQNIPFDELHSQSRAYVVVMGA